MPAKKSEVEEKLSTVKPVESKEEDIGVSKMLKGLPVGVGIDPDVLEMRKRPVLPEGLKSIQAYESERAKVAREFDKASDGVYRHVWMPLKALTPQMMWDKSAEVVTRNTYESTKTGNRQRDALEVRSKGDILTRIPARILEEREARIGAMSRARKRQCNGESMARALEATSTAADDGMGTWEDPVVQSYDRDLPEIERRKRAGRH